MRVASQSHLLSSYIILLVYIFGKEDLCLKTRQKELIPLLELLESIADIAYVQQQFPLRSQNAKVPPDTDLPREFPGYKSWSPREPDLEHFSSYLFFT